MLSTKRCDWEQSNVNRFEMPKITSLTMRLLDTDTLTILEGGGSEDGTDRRSLIALLLENLIVFKFFQSLVVRGNEFSL